MYHHHSLTGMDGMIQSQISEMVISDPDDSLSSFSEDGLGGAIPVIIPTSQSTAKFPNSDLRSYWKKATTDEKVEMNNHGFQMLRNTQEVKASEAVHDAQRKASHLRAQARDHQQHHRDRSHERKINEGWVPGQKRVSLAFFSHSYLRPLNLSWQKRVMDLEDDGPTLPIAEHSRPRRQYKEDARTTRKPAGRKRKHGPEVSKRVNWHSPFLWSQI
jgi:hypothetical protein